MNHGMESREGMAIQASASGEFHMDVRKTFKLPALAAAETEAAHPVSTVRRVRRRNSFYDSKGKIAYPNLVRPKCFRSDVGHLLFLLYNNLMLIKMTKKKKKEMHAR